MPDELKKLFVQRLDDEMRRKGVSANQLSRIAKLQGNRISQTAISNILRGEQDPSLSKLQAIAKALDLPAWSLLINGSQLEYKIIRPVVAEPKNVVDLPSPYPRVFDAKPSESHKKSPPARKKRVR